MSKKLMTVVFGALCAAVLTAVFVAFWYGARAERAEARLEDSYAQRATEAEEYLQSIGVKLGKTPVAVDADMQVELLTGVSRQAEGVVDNLSALPLSHIAMGETVKFCNQLSEYAMSLALSVARGETLTQSDAELLSQMESQCALLLGQLATAREAMVRESLRLASSDSAFYTENQIDARPLEQVSDADNGMDYPSMIYDGAFSDARRYGTPKGLGQSRVDAAGAVEAARVFVGDQRVREARSAPDSGGVIECWGVTLYLYDDTVLNAEVTKQGGHILWMVPERAEFTPTLTVEQCEQRAYEFIASRGYGPMEANHYQVYDGLAVINFVAAQSDVLLYPDLLKLQLRMDTGEVVGVEANNYLMNHTARAALTPTLTSEQAVARSASQFTPQNSRLCVIPYRDSERLCYELSGTYMERSYRVYIDAVTGAELEILMIIQNSDGRMSA